MTKVMILAEVLLGDADMTAAETDRVFYSLFIEYFF